MTWVAPHYPQRGKARIFYSLMFISTCIEKRNYFLFVETKTWWVFTMIQIPLGVFPVVVKQEVLCFQLLRWSWELDSQIFLCLIDFLVARNTKIHFYRSLVIEEKLKYLLSYRRSNTWLHQPETHSNLWITSHLKLSSHVSERCTFQIDEVFWTTLCECMRTLMYL